MTSIQGPYILGISEKPQAAGRLAWAIDENNKPQRKRINNVPVYICNRDGQKIVIIPAIGHLFTIAQIGRSWNYPTLDFRWIPSYLVDKSSRTKNFIDTFSFLSSGASQVIIMTDYDREGEVIGFLILKYLLHRESAERMKFSTLTKRDINTAFENREKDLNKGFLNAGLLRHYVDWLYGINFSRALSLSYSRVSGSFRTLSIGRVQGPTLSFVVEKEREINRFVPIPYWKIKSEVVLDNQKFSARYENDKIETLREAQQIFDDCAQLKGQITDIKEEEKKIFNYPPFNLSELQRRAYWHFKFSPSKTLKIAEQLYLKGIISYPRTDSQKLPMTLGHKQILSKLTQIHKYTQIAQEILNSKKFKPFEGKKTDAAHPAIHPTGESLDPKASPDEKKLFDLIVKRYFSLFARAAKQLHKDIEITINNHRFYVHGQQLIEEGWIKYYKPYISIPDIFLPDVKINSKVDFNYIRYEDYFTSPPQRYNESTLLKKMEDEKIGTKATRADIITTLFSRGYIEGNTIQPTPFGMAVETVLKDHYPMLITPSMTRRLEELMDEVQEGKRDLQSELLSIKRDLSKSLLSFHMKEEEIGLSLTTNLGKVKNDSPLILGKCVKCNVGSLRIIKSKKTGKRFIACSAYNDPTIKCDATYPLPGYGQITPTNQLCPHDDLPLVKIRKGTKNVIVCVSPESPSKKEMEK
ncbi:MAG: DNA topoisomerase I [Candidatus Heimdallarchaeaceae archaeon]